MKCAVKPVFFKLRTGHELQGLDVGGLQNYRRCEAGLQRFAPAVGAQAPAVPRFQAGEAVLWPRGAEIVAS